MDPMSSFNIRLVFTLPPRENWFQYVRRVYATAINFPCIITLGLIGTLVNRKWPPVRMEIHMKLRLQSLKIKCKIKKTVLAKECEQLDQDYGGDQEEDAGHEGGEGQRL